MSRCWKLIEKARASPAGLRFDELCALAECFGWTFQRQKGSHRAYTHPRASRPFVCQRGANGTAKAYQVRQLIDLIAEHEQDTQE
jgi:predicted RNA binding protein YcfA (HicA-like mRNA interferase family)